MEGKVKFNFILHCFYIIIDIRDNTSSLTAKLKKEGIPMSEFNFNTDLMKLLDLDLVNHNFILSPYPNSLSCIRDEKDEYMLTRYINIVSHTKECICPHCGCFNSHESKGLRKRFLTHKPTALHKIVLEVSYRRFVCADCGAYFKEVIPFQFKNMKMTNVAAQCVLHQFKENTAMAVIARLSGISKNVIYRMFHNHVQVIHRVYHLPSVISIDEFRATTDQGVFAFHICNPNTGKTIDILPDRKHAYLRDYFVHFPYEQRKKVKIIIMDLSAAFHSIMKALFPNAVIIADKFHYTRIIRTNMIHGRIHNCKVMKNQSLARLIKQNLHLFDQYHKRLDDGSVRYIHYFDKYMTCKQLVEAILLQNEVDELREAYRIYQNFLTIINEPHNDYKQELNDWLDHIFTIKNKHFLGSAKNFRKNWFLPILRSLTYKTTYIRHNKTYQTSLNNGFIESMNNKVKLVKRNAFGFSKFESLRKRILMHLGFYYEII